MPRSSDPEGRGICVEESILAVQLPAPRAQKVHLRAPGDEAFDGVEHLDRVGSVCGDEGRADAGAAMEVLIVHFRG